MVYRFCPIGGAVTKLMWYGQCDVKMTHIKFDVNMSEICRDTASDAVSHHAIDTKSITSCCLGLKMIWVEFGDNQASGLKVVFQKKIKNGSMDNCGIIVITLSAWSKESININLLTIGKSNQKVSAFFFSF